MSGVGQEARARLEQTIRAYEEQAAEQLVAFGVYEQEWAEYRQVMLLNSAHFEEACVGAGRKDYFVQKSLDSRREVDAFVRTLVDEQVELLEQTAHEFRMRAEVELERLREEKVNA